MQSCPPTSHLKLESPPEHERPSEERVRQLEAAIGASLPADYRAFLLEYGGSEVPFQAPVGEPSPFGDTFTQTRFHSLYSDPEAGCDIRRYLRSQIVPRNMIVIASGDFGQATCLSFAGVDKGAVFFFDEHQMAFADESHMYYRLFESVREFLSLRDREELGVKPPGYDHCYESAPSFTEFLKRCTRVE
ncbi:MAG: SMI1/KNR4 family protein [Verrucomicrobiales bacterium]|nr:SMI1/KNR4 family protein [Verrucomicrobiales bacterium]